MENAHCLRMREAMIIFWWMELIIVKKIIPIAV